jgi:hypothetical protein
MPAFTQPAQWLGLEQNGDWLRSAAQVPVPLLRTTPDLLHFFARSQLSVRKGEAGRFAELVRLQMGLFDQA